LPQTPGSASSKPIATFGVLIGFGVAGVEQDVDINQDHLKIRIT